MTSPARAYHHGHLRHALISEGLQLARTGGPAAVTLREATRAAGVSPNAAYRHFADRDTLVRAVAREAQLALAAAITARVEATPAHLSPADAAIVPFTFRPRPLPPPSNYPPITTATTVPAGSGEGGNETRPTRRSPGRPRAVLRRAQSDELSSRA